MSHNSNPSIIVTSSTDTSMSAANASIAPMNFNTGSLLPIASMNNGSFGRSEEPSNRQATPNPNSTIEPSCEASSIYHQALKEELLSIPDLARKSAI
ncbi:hypothetical protein V6N13_006048 [Hibiscus sabdariffa]